MAAPNINTVAEALGGSILFGSLEFVINSVGG
jgi:hypothetical protein